ncbi:TPA: hypothetical protein TXL63_000327 [Streptococcus suis]|nr:hypothetical protein [Streptococcus suis]
MDNFEIFILALAEEYGHDLRDPTVRAEIVRHLGDRLMNRINRKILREISSHLIDKACLLLEQGKVDEFQTILNQSGIDQTDIIVRTMLEFRKDYLGIK